MLTLTRDRISELVNSSEQFTVDFDDAWQWIGYSSKNAAKKKLTNNFIEDVDFSSKWMKTPNGGRPSEFILLTVDCFKSLAMMAGTEQGRKARQYFLDCERELKRVVSQPAEPLQKLAAIASLPPAAQKQHILQTSYEFLERTGGVDERDRLLFRDSFRNIALAERLQAPALPGSGRLEWPISDRATALGYRPSMGQLQRIGTLLGKLYQTRHGRPPVKREQFVGGTTRMVNVYGEADVDLMDQAIAQVMSEGN